jgi:hypothetical protein
VPAAPDVHLIVDNHATHKHTKVKAWLARRARYHMHFTPTYSSWLNQVERWFGLITQQAVRRGSFESVRQLISSIQRYVDQYNVHKRPFMWTATADSHPRKDRPFMQSYSWDAILVAANDPGGAVIGPGRWLVTSRHNVLDLQHLKGRGLSLRLQKNHRLRAAIEESRS